MATDGGDRTVVQVFRDGVLVNEYEGDPEFIPLHFDLSEQERCRMLDGLWPNTMRGGQADVYLPDYRILDTGWGGYVRVMGPDGIGRFCVTMQNRESAELFVLMHGAARRGAPPGGSACYREVEVAMHCAENASLDRDGVLTWDACGASFSAYTDCGNYCRVTWMICGEGISPAQSAYFEWVRNYTARELEHRATGNMWLGGIRDSEADERAESLLAEYLDDKQRHAWKTGRSIKVKAASGKTYTLGTEWVYCDGRRYCIQPTEQVPTADAVLARKLLLESDEAEFLRIANDITPGQFYEILNQQPIMPIGRQVGITDGEQGVPIYSIPWTYEGQLESWYERRGLNVPTHEHQNCGCVLANPPLGSEDES